MKRKILIMGAMGQIGSELTSKLRSIYKSENVVATDVKIPTKEEREKGPFEYLDVCDQRQTAWIVSHYNVGVIYNLPSLLSATAEKYPQKAFDLNLIGLYKTLEVARENKCAVFTPSTIGVFGNTSPKDQTPQNTIMRPETMYGVTKVSGELLCDYYHKKYDVDTRGLRYPGIISHKTQPGGGTTDFAVQIFYDALKFGSYVSYLKRGTFLDMMYIDDAIEGTIQLMESDKKQLKNRNAFNITSVSLDVETLAESIRKHIPRFKLQYDIDPERQQIAESWPNSLDDTEAREQWGWNPKYSLEAITKEMLDRIMEKES